MYNLEPSDVMELFVALFMFQFKSLHLGPSTHVSPWPVWGFKAPIMEPRTRRVRSKPGLL